MMINFFNTGLDAESVAKRLRARPGKMEVFALGMTICLSAYFVFLAHTGQYFPYDYMNYRNAAFGDPSFYYYGYWFLPFFQLLGVLPDGLQLVIYFMLNILAVWFAVRVFGGKTAPLLFGYQMLYGLYFGQLTGIIVGGLALFWYGMVNRRFYLAGLGLLIACTKIQTGLPITITLWLIAPLSWRERLQILIIPIIAVVASFAIYGFWPLEVLYRVTTGNPPNDWGSVSLWRLFGPSVLALWLPTIMLPFTRVRRMMAVMATTAIALPYFQQADLITLFVFPTGWFPLAGNIGLLFPFVKFTALQAIAVVPSTMYLWLIGSEALKLLRSRMEKLSPSSLAKPEIQS
ncbi:MAG: hypothetical protein R3E39_04575 [Anaerolineae bacterium]